MNKTGYIYDEQMCLHKCETEENHFEYENQPNHPECPDRIRRIMEAIRNADLEAKMIHVPTRSVTDAEILALHTPDYLNKLEYIMKYDRKEMTRSEQQYNSIYFNKHSLDAARLSAGGVIELVDHVVTGELDNGVAIVRPPGHHAESDCAMGFCLFNNVALAAKKAVDFHGLNRVVIIDWDVHHGNATQHMFYNDPHVMYISLHRYDHGFFYPASPDADPKMCGEGSGLGKNVNIAWNSSNIGDNEYIYAFQNVIEPIIREYNPELIIVSSGFDCAMGDPLGGLSVTPEGFGKMTSILKSLQPRLVVALEGGYNLDSISKSMVPIVRTLLDVETIDIENVPVEAVNPSAKKSVDETINALRPYWKCFE